MLKKGGIYVKIHLDIDDEYYNDRILYRDEYGFVSFDQSNGFMKRHFSLKSFNDLAAESFNLRYSQKFNFIDIVNDVPIERSVFASILEKKV